MSVLYFKLCNRLENIFVYKEYDHEDYIGKNWRYFEVCDEIGIFNLL